MTCLGLRFLIFFLFTVKRLTIRIREEILYLFIFILNLYFLLLFNYLLSFDRFYFSDGFDGSWFGFGRFVQKRTIFGGWLSGFISCLGVGFSIITIDLGGVWESDGIVEILGQAT